MSKSTQAQFAGGAGLSGHLDPVACAEQVCEQARRTLGDCPVDLALVFASGRHARSMSTIGETVGRTLAPRVLIGATAEGVVGGHTELERESGVSLLALSMPGIELQTFTSEDLPPLPDEIDDNALRSLADAIGADPETRAVLFFADPFSTPMMRIMPALSRLDEVTGASRPAPIIGGMASAGDKPGSNALILNDTMYMTGAIGVAISGPVTVDTVVSQGCKPIGDPMVITKARRNIIFTLGNRPALEALQETVESLPEAERELLRNGLFIGRVVDEYKEHFGRGDFLIRAVMGVEESHGAMAVGDIVRVGQTVQLHVRDAETASEDLEFLMSAQSLLGPAFGALVCTCNGRGTRLFQAPGHDALRITTALDAGKGAAPVAGFFAAGEIGPVGDESFLHGHTASIAVFRPGAPAVDAH
jgi:small ligand-binding sensory domain FIST